MPKEKPDSGVVIRVSDKGWTAYDKKGSVIWSNSDVAKLIFHLIYEQGWRDHKVTLEI